MGLSSSSTAAAHAASHSNGGSDEINATGLDGVTAGGLLAAINDPNSNVVSSSTTLADIDATNFAVTFVAPASGRVVVTMSGIAQFDTSTGKFYQWGLRQSTTIVGGPTTVGVSNGVGFYTYYSVPFLITGLTPSTSYTYKGAHARTSGATFAIIGGTGEERYLTVVAA